MTRRCECKPNSADWCGYCDALVSRAEENRLFAGSSHREADEAAEHEFAEWIAKGWEQ